MKKPRLSVAVATYNGERYLAEQLDSILKNIGPDDEIVLSDDGSSDATVSLIEEYRKKDARIMFIKGPGRGIKQNIAEAIKNCTGEIIFLSDQDDIWDERKVEKVLKEFEVHQCTLVMHDAKVVEENLKDTLMPSFFEYRGSVSGFVPNFVKNRFMGCCMAFDARLKPYILPIPDTIQMHDQWIGLMNEVYGNGTCLLPEKLLLYRRHGQNVSDFSHANPGQMLVRRVVLAKEIIGRMIHLSLFWKKTKNLKR